MGNDKQEKYSTVSHSENIDTIYGDTLNDFNDVIENSSDNIKSHNLLRELKVNIKLLRKKASHLVREKLQKNFTNILYLTLDCPKYTPNSAKEASPLDYISQMRKQYPDNEIRVLIPLINLNKEEFKPTKKISYSVENRNYTLEKTGIEFDFFVQNRMTKAQLYKFPSNNEHIVVYGLYSPTFSFYKESSEIAKIHNLAPFMKAVRLCIKFLKDFKPDIVHAENIPFYLGCEFENTFFYKTKVLQIIKDFTQADITKIEPFWAAINLADKQTMTRICQDGAVKKCIAKLFNLHTTQRLHQIKDCFKFIYMNYYKFRKYVDKGEDIEENTIFNQLNERTIQLFPQVFYTGEKHYNPMFYSIKKADFWATASKTYYKEVFENEKLSGKMYSLLQKSKERSAYLSYGIDIENYHREETRQIYEEFNSENFRQERNKNKITLLKEFGSERIKSNFIDVTLFKDSDVKIIGNLDSFYDAPLFFANPSSDIFPNGVDILFNTILKLFEMHKNIQVIINIPNGLKSDFIRKWVDFLQENKYLNGRWVFIDGNINLPKFLAGSDMILIPTRINTTSVEHFIAMHYGCVPIVAKSGILNDTIPDIFDDMTYGCGFKTTKNLLTENDTNELFMTPVLKALNIYQNNRSGWNLLIKNCLTHDSGWSFKTLEKYNKIYQELL
ncbi:MAG: hypothetical protein MJ231_00380 [bacterium]|nr:hypothetical protein [bacterium]